MAGTIGARAEIARVSPISYEVVDRDIDRFRSHHHRIVSTPSSTSRANAVAGETVSRRHAWIRMSRIF
jgi:hypothetical protein